MTNQGAGERFAACKATAEHSEPLTPAEVAEFESAKARVKATDEMRRQPSPQLDLDAAA